MYFHSQNLNELPGNKLGPMWREGRCWLHFGKESRNSLKFAWTLWKHQRFGWSTPSIYVGLGHHDEALSFHVAFYFFSFWFGLEHGRLSRWLQNKIKRKNEQYGNGRKIGISFHGGTFWFSLWEDPMNWSSSDPKWWRFNFNLRDFFLGRDKCTNEIIEEREILVPMPEKAYKASAKLVLYTWSRPRWFAKSITRVQIDVPEGLPKEGKGENSWDCGQDATYGMTTGPCSTIAQGVGILVGSVLEDRVRYGGWGDWEWKKQPVNSNK